MGDGQIILSDPLFHLWANSTFPGAIKYVAHSRCIIHVGDPFFQLIIITYCLCQLPCQTLLFGNDLFIIL